MLTRSCRYVSGVGILFLALATLAGWGSYTANLSFARAYAVARVVMVACVGYLLALRAPSHGVYKASQPLTIGARHRREGRVVSTA